MLPQKYTYLVFLLVAITCACNKKKAIKIVLPSYESKLVVECYLEPGKPYRLLLTESVSSFDTLTAPNVSGAVVAITYKGVTDTLKYITFTGGNTDPKKVYNFVGSTIVPMEYNEPYTLFILDERGRVVTGTTSLLPPVAIDTVEFKYDTDDTLGYAITRVVDNPLVVNYYRYVLLSVQKDTTQVQSLYFDGQLSSSSPYLIKSGNQILVKSRNEFSKNPNRKDKHLLNLYHIDQAYYKFLKSVNDSQDANGNPFAQPPSIKSNVEGGVGIFTGLSMTQTVLVSPK